MSKAEESFDEVWEKLKAEDKTGTFEKAEVLSFISCEALEYAYNSGYATAKAEFKRPQGEWLRTFKNRYYECPFCHGYFEHYKKFCGDCGAEMGGNKKETTFDDYLKEQLKDPEFRKEWEKLCDENKGGAE